MPHSATALFAKALQQHQQGDLLAAQASYRDILAVAPGHVDALHLLGVSLAQSGRHEEAEPLIARAAGLAPHAAGILNNWGNALLALGRGAEAVDRFYRALTLDPTLADAWFNHGRALLQLELPGPALESLDRALAIRTNHIEALAARAKALMGLSQAEEAIAAFDSLLQQAPDHPFGAGARLHLRMQLCDWNGVDAELRDLLGRLRAGQPVAAPFPLLALVDSPEDHRRAARLYMAQHPPEASLGPLPPHDGHPRVRVGYFSSDFHQHATAYLMAETFELHDRTAYEWTAFSIGPAREDAMRSRLRPCFDRFIDVRGMSDRAVAALARELRIDIAIDLNGLTFRARPGIFAARAAPVQASFLGYPGTAGAPFMDYVIADRQVIPAENAAHFDERVVWLPAAYQPNDRRRPSGPVPSRAGCGLPDHDTVFCCFNNTYKITPDVFASWMRILRAVEGSVFWRLAAAPRACENLRQQAVAAGVSPHRLVFAERVSPAEHLARHACADLVLDTLPYNAHTTASDALWTGVPVITVAGQSFAARVASSLLTAVGLPELVTASAEEYERLAIALGRSPAQLALLKARLGAARSRCALFDTPRFARELEASYSAMHRRRLAGLPPAPLGLQALD
ncbi:MAG: tetratricopeptide repeat protein [Betaproteobacteria bacterium]